MRVGRPSGSGHSHWKPAHSCVGCRFQFHHFNYTARSRGLPNLRGYRSCALLGCDEYGMNEVKLSTWQWSIGRHVEEHQWLLLIHSTTFARHLSDIQSLCSRLDNGACRLRTDLIFPVYVGLNDVASFENEITCHPYDPMGVSVNWFPIGDGTDRSGARMESPHVQLCGSKTTIRHKDSFNRAHKVSDGFRSVALSHTTICLRTRHVHLTSRQCSAHV